MSALFRAEVVSTGPRVVQIRLRVVSAEVRRLWNTKSFALSLILEPILQGLAQPSDALLAVLPREAIDDADLAAWKRAAPKVVTGCTLEVDRGIGDHLAELDTLDTDGIRDYFAQGRAPVATVTIKLKPDLVTHLARGLSWDSGACDLL